MMPPAEEPLRALLANAEVLAESLDNDRRPQSAALIRELIKRVVPMKVVRSGGSHPKRFVPTDLPPLPKLKPGVWCAQCDKLVLPAEVAACRSDFCKAKDA
jgi:hypothetical protein